MCTIVKVKRKISDEPADCLIIECKKKKKLTLAEQETIDEITSTHSPTSSPSSAATKCNGASSKQSATATAAAAYDDEQTVAVTQVLKYAGFTALNETELNEKIQRIHNGTERKRMTGTRRNRKQVAKSAVVNNGDQKTATTTTTTTSASATVKQTETSQPVTYVMVRSKRGLGVKNGLRNGHSADNEDEEDKDEDDDDVSKDEKRLRRYSNLNLNMVNIIDVVPAPPPPAVEAPITAEKEVTTSLASIATETSATATRKGATKEDDANYVYDIYYVRNSDIHLDLLYPNNYEIRSASCLAASSAQLVDELDSDEADESCYDDEDEDSNDEANWRNDYPDEDDDDVDAYGDEDDGDYVDYAFGGDDYHDGQLASYLKKSCSLAYKDDGDDDDDNSSSNGRSEDDDEDEQYATDDISSKYEKYKRKIMREARVKK